MPIKLPDHFANSCYLANGDQVPEDVAKELMQECQQAINSQLEVSRVQAMQTLLDNAFKIVLGNEADEQLVKDDQSVSVFIEVTDAAIERIKGCS